MILFAFVFPQNYQQVNKCLSRYDLRFSSRPRKPTTSQQNVDNKPSALTVSQHSNVCAFCARAGAIFWPWAQKSVFSPESANTKMWPLMTMIWILPREGTKAVACTTYTCNCIYAHSFTHIFTTEAECSITICSQRRQAISAFAAAFAAARNLTPANNVTLCLKDARLAYRHVRCMLLSGLSSMLNVCLDLLLHVSKCSTSSGTPHSVGS